MNHAFEREQLLRPMICDIRCHFPTTAKRIFSDSPRQSPLSKSVPTTRLLLTSTPKMERYNQRWFLENGTTVWLGRLAAGGLRLVGVFVAVVLFLWGVLELDFACNSTSTGTTTTIDDGVFRIPPVTSTTAAVVIPEDVAIIFLLTVSLQTLRLDLTDSTVNRHVRHCTLQAQQLPRHRLNAPLRHHRIHQARYPQAHGEKGVLGAA